MEMPTKNRDLVKVMISFTQLLTIQMLLSKVTSLLNSSMMYCWK